MRGFAICRNANDQLKPGNVRGHFCKICGREVQVSPHGVVQIKAQDLATLCTDCGLAMHERLDAAGIKHEHQMSPRAIQTIMELLAAEEKSKNN